MEWMKAPEQKSFRGFTLIELLVVIAIIGVLSVLGLANFQSSQAKARDTRRISDVREIITLIEQFNSDTGSYPGAACNWCDSTNGGFWITGMTAAYTDKLPVDPKHAARVYWYTSDGSDYCVQFNPERPTVGHRNYKTAGQGVGFYRFGPYGPGGGLCATR